MRFSHDDKGQGLVEYILIIVLVVIVLVAAVLVLEPIIKDLQQVLTSTPTPVP